jgi:hypothetical protein
MWDDTSTLAFRFSCFYPDLPGFGKTPISSNHVTLEEAAVQLEEWMEEQKIENLSCNRPLGWVYTLRILELMGNRIKGVIHSTALMTMKRKTFSKQNHRPIKSVS